MLALILVIGPWLWLVEQPECDRPVVRDTYECRKDEHRRAGRE